MPDTSVLDKLREAFKVEPPEPPPAGMTFEQCAALIGTLFALREPGQISLGVWAMQLRQALNFSEATKPLAEAIPLDEVPEFPAGSVGTEAEKRRELLSAIARAGLRLAEMHPIAAFGGDARQILAERVDEAVARSKPFLLGRWLLPAVIALILGGTVWGVISVRGLKADLRETQQAMDAMRNEVTTAAKQAEVEITNKSNETQTKLANLMKNELQQALKDTEDNITQTKTQVANAKDEAIMQFANWRAEAAPRVNTELKGISDWGTVQKKQVSDMADKERGEIAALLPIVEKAKADAKPTVDAELKGISDWGTVQKKQVSDMADKERGEIAALLPIVEKAKADAKPTVDAELKGISDWGTVQKKQVSDMADKERGEIAALLPIVEKAKADAKPTVDAELKGISDWGTVQKKQVSDMADKERGEIAALLPIVEKAKADAKPTVDANSKGSAWGASEHSIKISKASLA